MTNLALKVESQENDCPSVGDLLKEARLSQGLSLEEIAKTLCISKRHLVHLEEDQENLVCDVYTLGFLKSYVQYLGLNEKDFCKMFKSQAIHLPPSHLPFPAPLPGKGIPSLRILGFSFLLLLGVIVGWEWVKYSNSQIHPLKDMKVVETLPKIKPIPEESVALQNQSAISENLLQAIIPAEVTAPPENLTSDPETLISSESVTSKPMDPPENLISDQQAPISPKSILSKPTESSGNTTSNPQTLISPESLPSKPTDSPRNTTSDPQIPVSPQSVFLKATEETWVEVTTLEGTVILTRILRPGETFELKHPQSLVLKTGNAGGVSLVSGEKSIPSLGKSGEIKKGIFLDPEKWVEQSPETH
ncbi:MAG: hypothetical protein BGO67_09310 [Alphaproteobacteria bacterium 41-28]|nr:MAG: hypothetical protein BGO67_09310 [Alphaproteobacteria bacterium 41-28]